MKQSLPFYKKFAIIAQTDAAIWHSTILKNLQASPYIYQINQPNKAGIIMSIINTTDANFDQDVLQADKPVLVDFWAAWCGPCKAIAPTLEELADDYAGRAQIVKVNVDDNPEVAARFGIRSIPTLFVFKGGEKVDTIVGSRPKSEFAALLDKHL